MKESNRESSLTTVLSHRSTLPREERRLIVRRELGELILSTEQRVSAKAEIKTIELQQDSAVAEHQRIVFPIQESIQKLDAERLDQIANRTPVSASWQQRRDAEQRRLDAANLELETIIAKYRQMLKVANDKLNTAAERELALLRVLPRDALRQPNLANPDLLIAASVAGQAVQFAQQREQRAKEWLGRVRANVAEKEREATERRRKFVAGESPGTHGYQLRESEACYTAATAALAAAKRELQAALQAIEDE